MELIIVKLGHKNRVIIDKVGGLIRKGGERDFSVT